MGCAIALKPVGHGTSGIWNLYILDINLTETMNYGQVTIDPEIMSGTPVFAGTREPVQNLFNYLEGGEDINEFLNDFPSVSKEAVLAVFLLTF